MNIIRGNFFALSTLGPEAETPLRLDRFHVSLFINFCHNLYGFRHMGPRVGEDCQESGLIGPSQQGLRFGTLR
jgi:hypothetical protein